MEGKTQMLLHNSHICRLCAEENANGYPLFSENNEHDFSVLINNYLPIKITNDGKYPRWICPGCHLQIESTVQFFNLVEAGQRILENLYISKYRTDNLIKVSSHSETTDQAGLMKKAHFVEFTNTSLNENSYQFKRKRGRPKKEQMPATKNIEEYQENKCDFESDKYELGRRKRQIKIPTRFRGIVQGKELEKVFIENGVIEQSDCESDLENTDREMFSKKNQTIYPVEIIGHLQATDGNNLGDLVVINSRAQKANKKSPVKKTRFMCDICKVCFVYEQKFLQHRFSHHNVKFECKHCLKCFMDRNNLIEHQTETGHEGQGLVEEYQMTSAVTVLKPPSDLKKLKSSSVVTQQNSENRNEICQKSDEEYADIFENILDLKTTHSTQIDLIEARESAGGEQEELKDDQIDSNTNLKCSENQTDINVKTPDIANKSPKQLRYNCNICNHSFTRMASYIYHREREHNNRRRFICSKCNKSFRNKTMLQRHQLVHSNARPFTCNFCDAAFKTQTHLFYHKKTHTREKDHQCNICQRFFAHKNSLTLHVRSHTGYKPFKCLICEKRFTQHGNMQEHMRIHTGECPFECHICGRKFKTSSQVRMHTKRHEGNKPLKCNLCPKAFIQIVELRNHQRRHNNIRPYSCEVCGKSFMNSSAVRKHLRLHTGEKPYSCAECLRRFADRSNLKRHLNIHENRRKASSFCVGPQNTKLTPNEVIESYTSSLENIQNNLTTTGGKIDGLLEHKLMWDLIEEDVCFAACETSSSSANKLASNKQQLNITYPDLTDAIRGKTLFFVQNTPEEFLPDKVVNLNYAMTLSRNSNEVNFMQSASNVFAANSEQAQNSIQTAVILNIQNPLDLHLGQTCEIFRKEDSANKSICELEHFQQN